MEGASMDHEINAIPLSMPMGMGTVNTYLIKSAVSYLLIDTGGSSARKELLDSLERSGCSGKDLKLILITHGDFDHIGNAAYLRSAFGSRIAMHRDDSGMAEQGDMFVNRKKPNIIIKLLLPLFSRFGKKERFLPDFHVKDGDSLSEYGFDAKVYSLPGHSKGSIGILTTQGELFCGDLFENTKSPKLNSLMDDPAAARESIEILKRLSIKTIYPGHGQPFSMESLLENITTTD
jgi:glyoxylase-like metal-dependent hydrolase (beta-lactamase superfamily II)